MKIDFTGKDHKLIDGLCVMMETLEVYDSNGVLKGKLASADFPRTRAGIMDLLKSEKPKPKAKPEAKPEPEKQGISLHSTKNSSKSEAPTEKVTAKKKVTKKKRW